MGTSYNLIITEGAQIDILDASDWYEQQKKELGKLFMLAIDKCINLILNNPFSFALFYLQIRKANTNKFPYSIYFQIDESNKTVTIFAVTHGHRNEDSWKKRIDK